jgi:hypothetical protein
MKCPGCEQEIKLVANALVERHRKPDHYVCSWSGRVLDMEESHPQVQVLEARIPSQKSKQKKKK